MAGMEFEYDEKGGTFYYFLLSFLALVLIPATYYLWPKAEEKEDKERLKKKCRCEPCLSKDHRIKQAQPWKNVKRNSIKLALIIGWIITALVAYKASQVELDFTEFDPFKELDIDRGATEREVRKAYRHLSLKWHPDKETGDHKKFMKITRAYKALTDDEARKNWEEHGNPDGPGATTFGIALPKWIVERENSVWVLAAYGLVFMIILPVAVGSWWYRSIKFSAEQILMDTTQLYVHFFQKTPNMMLRRVIMILGSSLEFAKSHNNEIVMRITDNEELPALMRDLPHLNEKNKEKPLCYPFSVKARALLHAHFSRLDLPPHTLAFDQSYIMAKCPYLLNEMINIVSQLVAWHHLGRVSRIPRLDTVENVMKVSQMVVQAVWDNKSPLLQLPHITEDQLRYFTTKRRNIRSVRQFVSMDNEERRNMLRNLSDHEYRDVMNVCATMPHVTMGVRSRVIDEEDQTITAGSIVTVTVTLTRQNMEVLLDQGVQEPDEMPEDPEAGGDAPEEDDEAEQDETEEKASQGSPQKKAPAKVWEKQNKKKKNKGGKNKAKSKPKTKYVVKATPVAEKKEDEKDGEKVVENGDTPSATGPRRRRQPSGGSSDAEASGSEDELRGSEDEAEDNASPKEGKDKEEDEEEWHQFQQEFKKENQLESKSKETFPVHCPYFPVVKYEWWWLYIADRKSHSLMTAPVHVCSLKDSEEIQMKFYAPAKPGLHQYSVCLRSDSYLDFDISQNIKLDVKEAKKVEDHPQWDISEDEEDEGKDIEEVTESEGYTDEESDED